MKKEIILKLKPSISLTVLLFLLSSTLVGCNKQHVMTQVVPKELAKDNISNAVEYQTSNKIKYSYSNTLN